MELFLKKPGSNHNDLLPWFTMNHGQLPEAYLKSCRKFFSEQQATSNKRQAASLTRLNYNVIVSYKLKEKVNNED